MSDNNTIIVIGGGNHHNALGVIRALGERGYGVEFVSHGSLKKNYIASSRYVTKHVALADVEGICNYLMNNVFGGGAKDCDFLLRLCHGAVESSSRRIV